MGSFLAGFKAGTLASILYVGGIALFTVFVWYALKPDGLTAIAQTNLCSTGTATNSTGSLENCFTLVLAYDVPFLAFIGFFIALLYAGVFGIFYDRFPGSPVIRGETIAAVVGFNFVIFGFIGLYFDYESALAVAVFFLAWTVVFGYVLGKLYKRYTRLVSFESDDPDSLKVSLDGREVTGKARPLSLTSTHKLRADGAEGSSFREWVSSGGVSMEDSRSFETTFEVNGDGLVNGRFGKKY